MIDITKDSYNIYNEELKKSILKNISAIYILPQPSKSNYFYFFERFNGLWTYETIDGKYDYKIDDEATLETLIEELKKTREFDEDFIIKVFDYSISKDNKEKYENFIKFILPGKRNLIDYEIFADLELRRLVEYNKENIPEEDLNAYYNEMSIFITDVSQVLRVLSAQGHTPGTLRNVMNTVTRIVNNATLSPIVDDDNYPEDWVNVKTLNKEYKLGTFLDLDGYDIEDIYVNRRCTRLVKVTYKSMEDENKFETNYYDTASVIFIDEEENKAWVGKESIENIDLPWNYRPINEAPFDEKMKESNEVFIGFKDAVLS